MFVITLLVLLCCTSLFSFFENEKISVKWLTFAIIVVLLTIMAGMRPIGIDKDSMQYYGYFLGGAHEFVEYSFLIICGISETLFSDVRGVFVIYALLAIPLKCYAFTRLSDDIFALLAVYISYFYILHDLTQIRIGVSLALVFFGFTFLIKGKYLIYTICVLIATIFQYSAVMGLMLLLFRNKELNVWKRWVLAILPFIAFSTFLMNIDLISLIPIEYIQDRLTLYEELRDSGIAGDEKVNLLNISVLLKLVVFYFLLWKYDIVKEKCAYLPILLKTFVFSYCCFGLFSFLPILAFRTSEFFCFVEIMMVPLIIYAIEPKSVGKLLVSLYAIGMFLLNTFYAELLTL